MTTNCPQEEVLSTTTDHLTPINHTRDQIVNWKVNLVFSYWQIDSIRSFHIGSSVIGNAHFLPDSSAAAEETDDEDERDASDGDRVDLRGDYVQHVGPLILRRSASG